MERVSHGELRRRLYDASVREGSSASSSRARETNSARDIATNNKPSSTTNATGKGTVPTATTSSSVLAVGCPTVADYRGAGAIPLPPIRKNKATDSAQLSLPMRTTRVDNNKALNTTMHHTDTARDGLYASGEFKNKRSDVTRHASEALAVGHGNIFGKDFVCTTKGWSQGKFY